MAYDRNLIPAYFLYVGVMGLALMGLSLGLTTVVKPVAELLQADRREQPAPRELTVLDRRVESSREIRDALAKPLPRPEPLPTIVARVTQAASPTATASKADRRKLIEQARGAFARIEPTVSDVQSSAFTESDRHAVR